VSLGGPQLITTTRDLLERPDPMTAGIWPRASALLARQALEAALDDLWRRRAPGLEKCSMRAQLLCLPLYVPEELAERVASTWAGLSRACHQHPYELPPISSELLAWIAIVEELISRVQSIVSKPV
jgi:hypothetical protein